MAKARCSNGRERFVAEATRLFARHGYAATSVADIQLACGLTAGSGALYKHFPSKQALLAEVIGTHIDTLHEGSRSFVEQLPEDLTAALRVIADAVWAGMQRDRHVLRVLLRDLDGYPDLLEEVWGEVLGNVYGEFTRWLRSEAERGNVQVTDPAATAAVLLASLTYLPILDTLIGHHPGDIAPERFAEAWIRQATAALRPDGSTPGRATPP